MMVVLDGKSKMLWNWQTCARREHVFGKLVTKATKEMIWEKTFSEISDEFEVDVEGETEFIESRLEEG